MNCKTVATPATLLRDKIASVTRRYAQLSNNTEQSSARDIMLNADWSILVYTTTLDSAICNFVAR